MSFVGPLSMLFNQDELIALRAHYGMYELMQASEVGRRSAGGMICRFPRR